MQNGYIAPYSIMYSVLLYLIGNINIHTIYELIHYKHTHKKHKTKDLYSKRLSVHGY